jgi:hypothetical protein
MPGFPVLEQGILKVPCLDCKETFQYPLTRSNNYSKICPKCRERRTKENKRKHEDRRNSPTASAPEKDVYAILCDIPDYVMHPVKFIDVAIRTCQ